MRIIHTFSNQLHTTYTDFDILIWQASLIKLKEFGYTTVLYCTPHDINFLKDHNLFNYYDEINTDYIESSFVIDHYLKNIDETKFWSVRKLICLGYELSLQKSDQVVYLDTDVVLFKPLKIEDNVDLYTWSVMPSYLASNKVDLATLSVPLDYNWEPIQLNNHLSYNCGVLYFKTFDLFNIYWSTYFEFTVNNPGIFISIEPEINYDQVSWAQVAEQRLLYGAAVECGFRWQVGTYLSDDNFLWRNCNTVEDGAVHYCYLRAILDSTDFAETNKITDEWEAIYNIHYKLLSEIVNNS